VWILNFELLPNIQNNLDWHENFTTITRIQGEHNQTNFSENKHWMKKIQAQKVVAIKCSLVSSNWTCELWLAPKIFYISWIDLKILPHELEVQAQIFHQVLLNLDIKCKSFSPLNWTFRLWGHFWSLGVFRG